MLTEKYLQKNKLSQISPVLFFILQEMAEISKRHESGLENLRSHTEVELKTSMDRIAESIKVSRQEIIFDLRTLQAGTLRALKFMDQNQKLIFDGVMQDQQRIKKTCENERKTQENNFLSIKKSLEQNARNIENLMLEQEKTSDVMLNKNFEYVKKLASELCEKETNLAGTYGNMAKRNELSFEEAMHNITETSKIEKKVSSELAYKQLETLKALHETQIEVFTKSQSELTKEQANLIQKLADELKRSVLIGHEERSSNEIACHETLPSLYQKESEQILDMAGSFFSEIMDQQQQIVEKWATLYR